MANLLAQKGKINAKSVKQFASERDYYSDRSARTLRWSDHTELLHGQQRQKPADQRRSPIHHRLRRLRMLDYQGYRPMAGRMVGLSACLSAMLLQDVTYTARMLPWLPDLPVWVALIIVLLIVAFFGAINGCVIAFLKVPPFIATLGMQTIVYGLCSVITNNQPLGGFKQSYSQIAFGSLGPIPYLRHHRPARRHLHVGSVQQDPSW